MQKYLYMQIKVYSFLLSLLAASFLFLVVRPLLLVAMPFAPSSVLCCSVWADLFGRFPPARQPRPRPPGCGVYACLR